MTERLKFTHITRVIDPKKSVFTTTTNYCKMTKTLLQRIATAISTAPQGETYEDCRNNEAKAVILEVAKWLEESKTLTGSKCAFMLEQQVEPKNYSMRYYESL